MSFNRLFTNTDSLNISFLNERNKEIQIKNKEETVKKKKDIKVMSNEELDKFLGNTVSNIKIPERQTSSFVSSRFINLNLQDHIKNRFEKQVLKDSEKTEKLMREFMEEASKNKKKSVYESSDKIFQRSKCFSTNLFKSHNFPNLSSLLLSTTQFCKIQDKNDNYSRKCNEEKLLKLNEFLDDKLKDYEVHSEKLNHEEEVNLVKSENQDLLKEITLLKELIQRKDEDLKNYKEILSINESNAKENDEKLKNEIRHLQDEIISLKSSIDLQNEEIINQKHHFSSILSENEEIKEEFDNVKDKLRYANENLSKKQVKIEELNREINVKLLPEVKELKEKIKIALSENDLLRKKIDEITQININLEKTFQTENNKKINYLKFDKPNYLKNTKSKEKMNMSKSTEKKKKEIHHNKSLKETHKKKLHSSRSTLSISQEDELNKKIKEIEENIKEIQRNYEYINGQIENCNNREEILQLNRNMSLILSNLDREKKKLSILLLKRKDFR